jgi:hypothetical protein
MFNRRQSPGAKKRPLLPNGVLATAVLIAGLSYLAGQHSVPKTAFELGSHNELAATWCTPGRSRMVIDMTQVNNEAMIALVLTHEAVHVQQCVRMGPERYNAADQTTSREMEAEALAVQWYKFIPSQQACIHLVTASLYDGYQELLVGASPEDVVYSAAWWCSQAPLNPLTKGRP